MKKHTQPISKKNIFYVLQHSTTLYTQNQRHIGKGFFMNQHDMNRMPESYNMQYYPLGSYDDYLHQELSGFADELGDELLKANKNIAKSTLDQIKQQIYVALQKEINKVRGKTIEFLRYEIKSKLPIIKRAIEQEGPNLGQKGLVGLENLLRNALGLKDKKELPPETSATSNQMTTKGGSKIANPVKEPSNFLVDLMPNMEITVGDLDLINPKQAASQILTPDIIEEFKANTIVPLKTVAKQELLPPLKKKAQIAGSVLMGGGFVLGSLVTWGIMKMLYKKKVKNANTRY